MKGMPFFVVHAVTTEWDDRSNIYTFERIVCIRLDRDEAIHLRNVMIDQRNEFQLRETQIRELAQAEFERARQTIFGSLPTDGGNPAWVESRDRANARARASLDALVAELAMVDHHCEWHSLSEVDEPKYQVVESSEDPRVKPTVIEPPG